MASRAVVAAAVAVVALALLVTLAQSSPRTAGTNHVPALEPAVELPDGERLCRPGEIVPGDSASLRLLVGTFERPLPDMRVTIVNGGRTLADGRFEGGEPEGDGSVEIPLSREIERTTADSEVCVTASGPPRTVLFGSGGRPTFVWMRGGDESWLAMVPTVAHRFALGKSQPFGGLLLWVVALAALLAAAAAVALLVRELRE